VRVDPQLIDAGPPGPPFALGHEGVAEVVAVGPGVTGVAVGQLVVPAFQVSCGTCDRCARGHTAVCANYPVLSDYGMQPLSGTEYGGMLTDLVQVPHADAMLHPVPDGLTPLDVVGVADDVSDGYRSVAPHLPSMPGADVLVACHGNPSIALFATQAALVLGAGSVTFASHSDDALALADELGARPVRTDFARRIGRFPLVVDCGTRPEGLRYAIASTEPEGICHSVSGFVEGDVELPLLKMYTLGIVFLTGRVHASAVIPEVLAVVASGALRPRQVTTTLVPWDAAAPAYTTRTIKLVVSRE
jgi:alcohol dehydrogenase